MIHDTSEVRKMAKEAYRLKPEQVNEKLRRLEKWPNQREVKRIVPISEAMNRLKHPELAELVYVGFVLIMETEEKVLYPVRTFDFMTGLNSDEHVKIAKSDLELLIALKGKEAPLDLEI